MHPLIKAGRNIFAIALIADAVLQIIIGNFIICRPPGFDTTAPGGSTWAYISAAILIITGIAIIIQKQARPALLISGAMIILYAVVPYLPGTITDAFKGNFRPNEFKCLAFGGGAFILAASFPKPGANNVLRFITNSCLIITGRILLAAFFIICGVLHFQFDKFVAELIPAFIPAHMFWTYFAAVTLIAGGVGLLINKTVALASLLSGIMVLGWFVLFHLPRALFTPKGNPEWMGVFESLAFSGIFFALAGMMREKKK